MQDCSETNEDLEPPTPHRKGPKNPTLRGQAEPRGYGAAGVIAVVLLAVLCLVLHRLFGKSVDDGASAFNLAVFFISTTLTVYSIPDGHRRIVTMRRMIPCLVMANVIVVALIYVSVPTANQSSIPSASDIPIIESVDGVDVSSALPRVGETVTICGSVDARIAQRYLAALTRRSGEPDWVAASSMSRDLLTDGRFAFCDVCLLPQSNKNARYQIAIAGFERPLRVGEKLFNPGYVNGIQVMFVKNSWDRVLKSDRLYPAPILGLAAVNISVLCCVVLFFVRRRRAT